MAGKNCILVVDFGAQYAHLIARRIRQLGVYSEIVLPEGPLERFKDCSGVVLSGGPASVYEKGAPTVDKRLFSLGKPVLGLCYGLQLIAHLLGGSVKRGCVREFGIAELAILKKEPLFHGLGKKETVWMSHGDRVEELPPGFEVIGSTADCENAAVADFSRNFFGLQFHPEVTHTPNGMKMLGNFVFGVCRCEKDWSLRGFVEEKVAGIRKQAGEKNVFLLASGGVDSTVALALLSRALGKERVFSLHVDTGFMRKNESASIKKVLASLGFSELKVVDASDDFFAALKGIADPERKREIIGAKFVEVQQRELAGLGLDKDKWLLGQGTIYPDTIETAETKHAAKIKTHHNRVPIIKAMIEAGRVIEPLAQLYKDEVRAVGEQLGLPKGLVWRHPFPGPGLAIRCLCSERRGNAVPKGLDAKIFGAVKGLGFSAMALPVKSVGVQGDARTYAHPALLQGKLDWKAIEKASTLLTNGFREVNRCVFAVAPQKVVSVEPLKGFLSRERIGVLQEADAIVMDAIEKLGLLGEIWQFPTILLPLKVNGKGETIVLRPVESTEAMTARFYPMKENILNEIAEKLLALQGVGAVFYDVTHKPPGTIEWE
ncbi:MAG: glutamine-hydrolyzing GMP synthase [archaeon]